MVDDFFKVFVLQKLFFYQCFCCPKRCCAVKDTHSWKSGGMKDTLSLRVFVKLLLF